jgi:hypothetical protein
MDHEGQAVAKSPRLPYLRTLAPSAFTTVLSTVLLALAINAASDEKVWPGPFRWIQLFPFGAVAALSVILLLTTGLSYLYQMLGPQPATDEDLDDVVEQIHDRFDTIDLVEPEWSRQHARDKLRLLNDQALTVARERLGSGTTDETLHFDRSEEKTALIQKAKAHRAVVVWGESGVGKSALALAAVQAAATDGCNVLCLNLRQLPTSVLELNADLGCPLAELLDELPGPTKLLVLDAADAVAEDKREMFAYLAALAREHDLNVIAVTATDSRQVVRDLLAEHNAGEISEHNVAGLSNDQLLDVAERFPSLAPLVADPRSRELLRRLVVVDLLARSGVSGLPLSNVEAMQQIWSGLVRRNGRSDRGFPDARQDVLLRLAEHQLRGTPSMDLVGTLNPEAVNGLRQDGILQAPASNSWQVVPDFAHDEIRRYAVARVLLAANDLAGELQTVGAPRWALAAGKLACQAKLGDVGLHAGQRFQDLQASFDHLVASGVGARWGDVPSEALLTVDDPAPLLAGAWLDLRSADSAGLQRLIRLVGQRHRDVDGFLNPAVAEPIVALLLNENEPWNERQEITAFLREWLVCLIVRDTPQGHRLRVLLLQRLIEACAVGDAALAQRRQAAAAAKAARTPEEIEHDRVRTARSGMFFGSGRVNRRRRQELPRELTDETALEMLALLGPDLGDGGEQLLRRVAGGAPHRLAPALERPTTGRALAAYGHGLLADLTEAYYIVEDEDGTGLREDGIRRHTRTGTPLTAWYYGPFAALFQADFWRGITVLNRMLNHAALVRARMLACLGDPWCHIPADAIDRYKTQLNIGGAGRVYIGDSQIWPWYRGTGSGPYPCRSALLALERVCDQLIAIGVPLRSLVPPLLRDGENLATLGFATGLIVRHIEQSGDLLDPFLAEPEIWELESARATHGATGLVASSDDSSHPERRRWSLGDAAMHMVVRADPVRSAELKATGARLVTAAERVVSGMSTEADQVGGDAVKQAAQYQADYLARVRNWACALDHERYEFFKEDGQAYLQVVPPNDLQAAVASISKESERSGEVVRLNLRYCLQQPPTVTSEQLATDLKLAQALLDDPPPGSPESVWDAAAGVSSIALERHFLLGQALETEAIEFAADVVLGVAEGVAPPPRHESEGTYFRWGASRSAARAMPLLLLPAAEALCEAYGTANTGGRDIVINSARHLAQAVATETRLYLARGLDSIWREPCHLVPCNHEIALGLVVDSLHDCLLGEWDQEAQQRPTTGPQEDVADALRTTPAEDIYVSNLDPAIRALSAAITAETCVHEQAEEYLLALLDAQRRTLVHEPGYDDHGSNTLTAARALLQLAHNGILQPLVDHIAAFTEQDQLLATLLPAIAAAAEETPEAAEAARQIWPAVMSQVLDAHRSDTRRSEHNNFENSAIAALIPNRVYHAMFLYRELEAAPIIWADANSWQPAIDAWIETATGRPQCIDSLIIMLETLTPADQVSLGL